GEGAAQPLSVEVKAQKGIIKVGHRDAGELFHEHRDGVYALFRGAPVGRAPPGGPAPVSALRLAVAGDNVSGLSCLQPGKSGSLQRIGQAYLRDALLPAEGGELSVGGEAEGGQLLMGTLVGHVPPLPLLLRLAEDDADAAVKGDT